MPDGLGLLAQQKEGPCSKGLFIVQGITISQLRVQKGKKILFQRIGSQPSRIKKFTSVLGSYKSFNLFWTKPPVVWCLSKTTKEGFQDTLLS